jgi:hypothetical protein
MRISVDCLGNVRGKNKNNAEHAGTAREKVYTGKREGNVFKLDVYFPATEQVNTYEGTIENGLWKGRFKLIKSTGHRNPGDGGIMEGKVKEC